MNAKPFFNFSRVWTKNPNCWEIFDETSIEKLNFSLFLEKKILQIFIFRILTLLGSLKFQDTFRLCIKT